MSNNIFISIILPVYQSALTLKRCIDSILSQTYTEFELLIIDDGSTDDSYNICRDYEDIDSRVRLIRREHYGVSDCRQFGIEQSRGEYILFCDSDDWMERNMVESLWEKKQISDADIIVCGVVMEYGNRSEKVPAATLKSDVESLMSDIHNPLLACVWNKLIRKKSFELHKIKFPSNLSYAEDLFVVLSLLSKDVSISYVKQALYHYDQYSNSLSLTRNLKLDTIIKSTDYIGNNLDIKASVAVQKLKCHVIQLAYQSQDIRYKSLYKESDQILFRMGMLNPIYHWQYLVIFFERNHLSGLGKLYAAFIKNAVKVKSKLRNFRYQ